jgi:hypothetical protein
MIRNYAFIFDPASVLCDSTIAPQSQVAVCGVTSESQQKPPQAILIWSSVESIKGSHISKNFRMPRRFILALQKTSKATQGIYNVCRDNSGASRNTLYAFC